MARYCHSCSHPLGEAGDTECEGRGPHDDYCKWCVDADGALLPRGTVERAIADWLKTWQPGLTDNQAVARAQPRSSRPRPSGGISASAGASPTVFSSLRPAPDQTVRSPSGRGRDPSTSLTLRSG